MNYHKLYELFENSGKQVYDIGNFWDCVARNLSYHIINSYKKSIDDNNKAIIFLRRQYSNLGLCVPNECNDILLDFINSEYYKNINSIKNISIFSYIPLSNGAKKKQNHYKLEKTEIVAIIFIILILFFLFIKILTPILFGTCLYKYSYLKYTKGNNYISVEDNLTDDDEELNDDNDNDNVQLFRLSKLSEMNNEEVNNHKNITLKSVVLKKHIQSFFSLNINFNLLLSHSNFLYNNNLLMPLSFFKSLTLFMLFYNESFYALVNLPVKNNLNENFYFSLPMIWVKYSSFFIDVYIALEGFLFIYKLFNYIIKHHNNQYFGITLLFFYAKTIPKLITCICVFFIFNIGLRVIEKNFDLSPFVEYIGVEHQKECLINLSYIFIPFKLQYIYNNSCIDRLYELCYRYMYVNLNIQISITFFILIIYLIFKFKDELFDKLILLLFLFNTLKKSNDAVAELIRKYPGRFLGAALLPTLYVDEAVKELERCKKELGFSYWHTHSNYLHSHLYEEKYLPLLAKAEELGCAFYLHPQASDDADMRDFGYVYSSPGLGFGLDTMKTALRIILNGTFDRFPKLRMILGHLGEYFPFILERVDNRFRWIKEPEIRAEHEVSYYFRNRNVLVTTSGNMSKLAFECTRKAIGIDSIIFGSDYPYENLADMMKFMDSLDLSPEDQEKVFHLNAEKYLL